MVRSTSLAICILASIYCGQIGAQTSPFPFQQPSIDQLRASPKKVFAHYFAPFPPYLVDSSGGDKYKNQYLKSDGASHTAWGAYLRERPLPPPAAYMPSDPDWRIKNMRLEVQRAKDMGLDGFTVDILNNSTDPDSSFSLAKLLMQAAVDVDPDNPATNYTGFKIIPMPDMDTLAPNGVADPTVVAGIVQALAAYPAAYRLPDGRLVVAPYDAQGVTGGATWWNLWLQLMASSMYNVNVAFLPLFQGWGAYRTDYKDISIGYSDWGISSAYRSALPLYTDAAASAHGVVGIWMAPVRAQDVRPKNGKYWESQNSLNLRKTWETAIRPDLDSDPLKYRSDWVQLVTWNDYSESTEFSPSTQSQYGFYDLSAYYLAWFKSCNPDCVQPPITNDVLYYFHRTHSSDPAVAPPHHVGAATFNQQAPEFQAPPNQTKPKYYDNIELLGFLTAPGTLEIRVGGVTVKSQAVGAGIQSVLAPVTASTSGAVQFRLVRNGVPVALPNTDSGGWFSSAASISNNIDYQDMLYHAGSNSRLPVSP